MIFLSHNHKDKAVVEQIALRLRDTFGQENIFYDSWSMQPGDGIIDKMNEALGCCRLFLFFVSRNSLQSQMVKLEWQNAIMRATSGGCKIIPVKLDECLMPAIFLQSLYIDLFSQGMEIALRQIVDVTEGRNTFRAGPQEFSNLRAYTYSEDESVIVECRAEHFLEPKSHFMYLVRNEKDELSFSVRPSGGMQLVNFFEGVQLNNGKIYNAKLIKVDSSTAPGFPFLVVISSKSKAAIQFEGVMHEKRQDHWELVPLVHSKPSA